MNLSINSKIKISFLVTCLFLLIAQLGYSKASFPIETAPLSVHKSKNDVNQKTRHFKFKSFKKVQPKKERRNLFGVLAMLAFIASIVSLSAFPFSVIGPLLAAALFITSCILAYYGTSTDKVKRLAKLMLIIDLVIALSTMLSFFVISIISL